MRSESANVVWFEDIGRADVPLVGGKSASLRRDDPRAGAEGHQRSARLRNNVGRLLAFS